MLTPEQKTVLGKLAYFTTFLALALPIVAVPTFCELLIAGMLAEYGFVTRAYQALSLQCHWTCYYKFLERGKWDWSRLGLQLLRLNLSHTPKDEDIFLALDDYIVLRKSDKAPGSKIHHQHGNKPNLKTYVRGQCWVCIAFVRERLDEVFTAIPFLHRMPPRKGNTSKLWIAKGLLRFIRKELKDRIVWVLTDAWYMRSTLILPAIDMGYRIIGQVRHDTALYLPPEPEPKRPGRPRKYGIKLTPEKVQLLPATSVRMHLYGQMRKVIYRSAVCRARFLKGREVKAVWCRFVDKDKQSKPRLIISTEPSLGADKVLRFYSRRWPIEPGFHQLKHGAGCKDLWQRTRRTLHRWMQIKTLGYALLQLLTLTVGTEALKISCLPWRSPDTVTAGMLRQALVPVIAEFNVRSCWDQKCRKFYFACGPPANETLESIPKAA